MGNGGAILIWCGLAGLLSGPAFAACSDSTLMLQTETGVTSRFTVEVADDGAERAQGLMHRARMPLAAGMLFVYDHPGRVSFWMENTLIPLDMLFADPTGRVLHVHENAVPLDRTPIRGGDNIKYVLEINGGLARRMGIDEGALIAHPAIDQTIAALPCTVE
jgi:uncharacterized protein